MIIKTVEIQNFGSFKEAKFSLENQDITLISGYSEDNGTSNGSGKSTLIEALCWCLFGVTPKGLRSDDVINRLTKKNCVVQVVLEEADNKYVVTRGRKHSKWKNGLFLTLNGQLIQGKDSRETQEIIERQIGVDFITFTNSILFPQNGKFRFVQATDTEKKDILSNILGLEWIDGANAKVKLKITDNEANSYKYEERLSSLLSLSKQFEDNLVQYDENLKDFEDKKKERLDDLLNQKKSIEQQLSGIDAKNNTFLTSIEQKINKLAKQKRGYEEDAVVREELQKELNKLSEKLHVIKELRLKKEILSKNINSIENNISSFQTLEREKKKRAGALSDLSGKCPTCEQAISEGHIKKCSDLVLKDAEELKFQACDEYKKIEPLHVEMKQLDEIISYETVIQDKYNALFRDIQIVDNNCKQVAGISREINQLTQECITIRKSIIEDKEKIEKEIAHCEAMVEKEQNEQNPFEELIKKENSEKDKISKNIKQLQKEQKKLSNEGSYLLVLKDLFSNKGLKSFILDSAVYELNIKADGYIERLFDGALRVSFDTLSQTKAGDIRQKIGSTVLLNGQKTSLEQLSGGELKRVSLAVDLALSDLIANRSNKNFNVLIFDEVTENLDEAGRVAFFGLLQDLKKSKDSIFVITHNEVLRGQFDNVLNVKKANGVSTICH